MQGMALLTSLGSSRHLAWEKKNGKAGLMKCKDMTNEEGPTRDESKKKGQQVGLGAMSCEPFRNKEEQACSGGESSKKEGQVTSCLLHAGKETDASLRE